MSYTRVFYPQLRKLLDNPSTQLVEVLPPAEYEELHLPRAISIPLKTLDEQAAAGLHRREAVVVYCWDALCDMSPRAASRLTTLGFEHVFDYMPSKVDWMARGLPMEGEKGGEPRVIDFARNDVVTCRLDDTLGDVCDRVAASPHGFAFVTTDEGILLGRLRKDALDGNPDRQAGDLMEAGPSTTRPDLPPMKVFEKLRDADLTTAVLTDPEGKLLGIVRRDDLCA